MRAFRFWVAWRALASSKGARVGDGASRNRGSRFLPCRELWRGPCRLGGPVDVTWGGNSSVIPQRYRGGDRQSQHGDARDASPKLLHDLFWRTVPCLRPTSDSELRGSVRHRTRRSSRLFLRSWIFARRGPYDDIGSVPLCPGILPSGARGWPRSPSDDADGALLSRLPALAGAWEKPTSVAPQSPISSRSPALSTKPSGTPGSSAAACPNSGMPRSAVSSGRSGIGRNATPCASVGSGSPNSDVAGS